MGWEWGDWYEGNLFAIFSADWIQILAQKCSNMELFKKHFKEWKAERQTVTISRPKLYQGSYFYGKFRKKWKKPEFECWSGKIREKSGKNVLLSMSFLAPP